jgi:hypothetical protein
LDSLASANVPFKLRLKTKNKNRFASLQKESELSVYHMNWDSLIASMFPSSCA